ncbi:hypothetical protein OROMI_011017 [Orobanche minor]
MPLEDITESLKIAGLKALGSVERNVRQASRSLKQGRTLIVGGLAKAKVDDGTKLLKKLESGLDELQKFLEAKNRDAVAPKQKELLDYVGGQLAARIFPLEFRGRKRLEGKNIVGLSRGPWIGNGECNFICL